MQYKQSRSVVPLQDAQSHDKVTGHLNVWAKNGWRMAGFHTREYGEW